MDDRYSVRENKMDLEGEVVGTGTSGNFAFTTSGVSGLGGVPRQDPFMSTNSSKSMQTISTGSKQDDEIRDRMELERHIGSKKKYGYNKGVGRYFNMDI